MSRDCHAYATCHCEYNAAIPWRMLAMTICSCPSLRGVIATKQSKWVRQERGDCHALWVRNDGKTTGRCPLHRGRQGGQTVIHSTRLPCSLGWYDERYCHTERRRSRSRAYLLMIKKPRLPKGKRGKLFKYYLLLMSFVNSTGSTILPSL